ncbi:class I SAM-dependent methyltransferase [Actinacidiphila bryophytorum]|uniref:class I SAM-dependent methyltransferase n=1 Tax=Actinacidiphila bryophytorum TaxID=1436133 RepID=UPI002176A755|nr:class I SAM-dependent methyltransferase [Actinacidiphila bryophytorum]UWE09360.1 class I SAM-dependent methyltransferase [Actinacidiphila bryophytorum]
MPTVPFSGNRPPHRERGAAESFGADTARYERTRPGYPDALIAAVTAAAPGPDLLDVGCGTGIAARQFRAAGCRVLGVDPDPRMVGAAAAGGLDAEVATFESWDPAGRRFDAVVAGQAWHWIDPAAGAERAALVLRPGGLLAPFWNVARLPQDLAEAVREVYARVLPDAPVYRRVQPGLDAYVPILDTAADGIRQAGAFTEPERWRFDWQRAYTRDEWLDQVPTFGGHSGFPPAVLAALLSGIGEAVDAAGGGFTVDYAAVALAATRLPAA